MKKHDPSAILPTSWEALAVFRETFLKYLPPKDAEAYRRMGRRMYFDRQDAFLLEDIAGTESLVRGDLASAADDLGVLAGFLADVGSEERLPPEEEPLASLARDCAAVVAAVAQRLRSALQKLPELHEQADGEAI